MNARRKQRGFTLIELVVALGVVVVLFSAVVYGVGSLTGAKAKEASGELAGTIRALYDSAALSGKTCRLVFELPRKGSEEDRVKYHAECAKAGVTAGANREDEQRDREKAEREEREKKNDSRFRALGGDDTPNLQELMAREKNRVEDSAKYQAFSTDDVVERTLPRDVEVEVWTSKVKTPTKTGAAYLYFFPQGFTERAYIYVRQGKNVWTLVVSPLTGKTVIHGEAIEVPRT